jgi:hypothetical protein
LKAWTLSIFFRKSYSRKDNDSNDILIYPKSPTTIEAIEAALKDKANYKRIFTELSPNELEGYFGPQALPNVKRSMETLFPTLSKEELLIYHHLLYWAIADFWIHKLESCLA